MTLVNRAGGSEGFRHENPIEEKEVDCTIRGLHQEVSMNTRTFALIAASLTGFFAAAAALAASDEELIESATSAAPESVAKDATILEITADGKMRTVREGKNAWWCMPDTPST